MITLSSPIARKPHITTPMTTAAPACTLPRVFLSPSSSCLLPALRMSSVKVVVMEVSDEPELLNAAETSPSTNSRPTTGGISGLPKASVPQASVGKRSSGFATATPAPDAKSSSSTPSARKSRFTGMKATP